MRAGRLRALGAQPRPARPPGRPVGLPPGIIGSPPWAEAAALRAVVRRLALAFATLLFGRQIAAWSDPDNRYLYHWQRADGGYLIAAVLLAALLLFGAGAAFRRVGAGRPAGALRLLLALALGQVLVGLVPGDRSPGAPPSRCAVP